MYGKATEAIYVSSTSINVGSITAGAINHGLTRGRQASLDHPHLRLDRQPRQAEWRDFMPDLITNTT